VVARTVRRLALLLAVLGLLATWSGVASAELDSATAPLQVRAVDASDPGAVALDYLYVGDGDPQDVSVAQSIGDSDESSSVEVTDVAPLPEDPGMALSVVIDSGPGMDESGGLVNAKEAAKDLFETLPEGTLVSIVQAGDVAAVKQGFTANVERLVEAVDAIGPSENAAVWNAVEIGAGNLAEDAGDRQASVVVITGSADEVSGDRASSAAGELSNAGAAVFVARLPSGVDLDDTVRQVGGLSYTADDADGLADAVSRVGTDLTEHQFRVVFDSATTSGDSVSVTLDAGGASTTSSFLIGGTYEGLQAVSPEFVSEPGGVEFLQGGLGLLLAVVVVLVAVAALTFALASLMVKEDRLSQVLQPYSEVYGTGSADDDEPADTSVARTAIIQRAVALTENVAREQGALARTEAALERADLPLRAGEALFFYLAVVVLFTIGALFLFQNILGGLLLGAIAAIVPLAVVSFLGGRRRRRFMAQLPDTLSLLSGTLRAGYSLMQGVEAVSQEVEDPMGQELRRVVTEARLGRPLEDALDASAERMGSPDFSWAVMAIKIQREVGGNLSELLLTVADTMIARERLRRDIASLTAEGRMSAIILLVMPIGLGVMMYVINPEYMSRLFDNALGIGMLIASGVSMFIGFLWMRKIINIEI
jgi:tight adherence protein B